MVFPDRQVSFHVLASEQSKHPKKIKQVAGALRVASTTRRTTRKGTPSSPRPSSLVLIISTSRPSPTQTLCSILWATSALQYCSGVTLPRDAQRDFYIRRNQAIRPAALPDLLGWAWSFAQRLRYDVAPEWRGGVPLRVVRRVVLATRRAPATMLITLGRFLCSEAKT